MPTDRPAPEAWRRALEGDADAFEEALAPYQKDLRDAAERQLQVERDVVSGEPLEGERVVDLTPDELVGETLLRAFDLRERYQPEQMAFRAWLLGLQTRSLARFARREDRYAARKAISLDEELPNGEAQDAVGEQFYEFRQPFDVDTYEEVIVGGEPADPTIGSRKRPLPEADLSDADRDALADASFAAEVRQAAVLHDEFEVSLPEVAQILDASLKDTAAYLNLARTTLSDHLGPADDPHDDDPVVDSYTGDPLPDA